MRRLFLICPTDNLELHIRDSFQGEPVFYTALGVYFDFEMETQLELWKLIEEQGIDHIVYISSIQNVFYDQAFEADQQSSRSIDLELAKSREKLKADSRSSTKWVPNRYLLAVEHLESQIRRLLETGFLGDQILNSEIDVDAYVFRPKVQVFHSLEEIMLLGNLTRSFSLN